MRFAALDYLVNILTATVACMVFPGMNKISERARTIIRLMLSLSRIMHGIGGQLSGQHGHYQSTLKPTRIRIRLGTPLSRFA